MSNGTGKDNNESKNFLYRIVEGGPMMLLIAVAGLIITIALLLWTGNAELLNEWTSEAIALVAGGGSGYWLRGKERTNAPLTSNSP